MIQRVPGVVIAARYRLVRQLGVGGMGTVWLAHDLLLDSSCALKLIDDDKAQSEEVRLRFAREAKVAAQLRGSHVVDVFEHGEWEGIPYIAMEFLDGEDLGTRLDRLGRLDLESTYRIIAHVARALSRAHSLGIVHRDLKPENIFLVPGDDGEIAKVLDFGIAKHDAYSLRDKATKTGSFLGTPFYVSPEQARGKDTDHRSDLWSLGVIAFQCLTGAPPFESEALGELMGLILYEDLPMPTHRHADLPAAIDPWWARAASREREDRFQSARELADSLGQALGVAKLIAVATLPVNRQSFADIQLPMPADPRLAAFPGGVAPKVEVLSARTETDAPLSRTRISSIPLMTRIRGAASVATSPHTWIELVRGARRRQLAAAGVLGGIALGVLLTVLLSGGNETPTVSTAVAAAIEPAPSPSPVPRPEVIPTAPAIEAKLDLEAASPAPSDPTQIPSPASSSLVGAVEKSLGVDKGQAPARKAETSKDDGKSKTAKSALTAPRSEAPAASASSKRKSPKAAKKRDYGI